MVPMDRSSSHVGAPLPVSRICCSRDRQTKIPGGATIRPQYATKRSRSVTEVSLNTRIAATAMLVTTMGGHEDLHTLADTMTPSPSQAQPPGAGSVQTLPLTAGAEKCQGVGRDQTMGNSG